MLKALHLENFKAFGNRSIIPLAPVTLIYGENSAGKSSIIQALKLLKQTNDSTVKTLLLPRSENGIVDLGSINEMVFDHELERVLKIRIETEEGEGIELQYQGQSTGGQTEIKLQKIEIFQSDELALRFEAIGDEYRVGNKIFNTVSDLAMIVGLKCTYITDSKKFWEPIHKRFKRTSEQDLATIFFDMPHETYIGSDYDKGLELRNSMLDPDRFTEWVRRASMEALYGLDDFMSLVVSSQSYIKLSGDKSFSGLVTRHIGREYRPVDRRQHPLEIVPSFGVKAVSSLIARVFRDTGSLLDKLFPIEPFRKIHPRWHIFSGTTPSNVGFKGEFLPDLVLKEKMLLQEINIWLKRLGIDYELQIIPYTQYSQDVFEIRLKDLRRVKDDVTVNLRDVGFGVSQILPFVVQSLTTDKRIISIEQPEVHIHPKLQAEIGDLLIEAIERENQLLIETHSEHLILRLMRRIREGKLHRDKVSILYVARGKEGASVYPLRLDEEGGFIDAWPDGFFPERLNELL